MVKTAGTRVLTDSALHFYVDHQRITYDTKALDKFGDRRKDRKPGVPSLAPFDAISKIVGFTGLGRVTLGGKNVGNFDSQFLLALYPGFTDMFRHRFLDIGNKFEDPLDDMLPDLETCRLRGLKCGILGDYIKNEVSHTALEDACVCAELYCGWLSGLVDYNKWRNHVE